MLKKVLPAFAAAALIGIGCASVNKALDKADADLDKANQTIAKADKVVNKAIKTASDAKTLALDKRLVVNRGDTLWGLSQAKLGTGFLWPLLCDRNSLTDCDLIEVGQVLRYPAQDALSQLTAEQKKAYLKRAYDAPDSAKATSK